MSRPRAHFILLLLLAQLSLTSAALAHGPPPRAVAALDVDGRGALTVKLSVGLAQRAEVGFRFVCPAAWGGESSALSELLPSGELIGSAGSELYSLDRAGRVQRVTSMTAAGEGANGAVLGLVRSSSALFALRSGAGKTTLERITSAGAVRIWESAEPIHSVAASDATLQLVAIRDNTVSQILLSLEGRELERLSSPASADVISAQARMIGDVPYLVLRKEGGGSVLGRVEAGSFRMHASAADSIAGPIATSSGAVLLALDGRLHTLRGEQLTAHDESEFVSCLGSRAGRPYACVRDGLRALEQDQLAMSLFSFADLIEPELSQLPVERRAACEDQWLHLRFDLIAASLLPIDTAAPSSPDASHSAPQREDGGTVPIAEDDRRADDEAGCSLASAAPDKSWLTLLLASLPMLLWGGRCARRRCRSDAR
jgi:hypothetical protein